MSAILFSEDEKHMSCDTATTSFGDTAAYLAEGAPLFDVSEELLGNKMNSLNLNEDANVARHQQQQQPNFDGSDSGVDVATNASASAAHANVTLQRALSSNSGGYTSSNGGLDDHTAAHAINMSCDSSVISCSSDFGEQKAGAGEAGSRSASKYEYCSEHGSDSSSVTGSTAAVPKTSSVRKKVAMFEPSKQSTSATPPTTKIVAKQKEFKTPASVVAAQKDTLKLSQARPRLSTLKRTASLPRPSQSLALQTRDFKQAPAASDKTETPFRGATPSRGSKLPPDSLPSGLSRTQSMSMQRLVQRTPSLSRARTPGTPSDDGRWPGINACGHTRSAVAKRGLSATPDLTSLKTRSSMLASLDARSSSSNPYSTLPRRRKQKSVEDLTGRNSRSSSISRDSRMTSSVMLSSRRNLVNSYGSAGSPTHTHTKMLPSGSQGAKNASAVARKTLSTKTRIYHETSVQTALTCSDLETMFAGGCNAGRPVDAAEQRDQETQSDIRNPHERELERLRDEVRQLTQREHELGAKLQREREEKLVMQRELHVNTERVIGMLEMARVAGGYGGEPGGGSGTPNSDDSGGGHDSLLMLESQIQISGHELIERQQEIGHLRHLCRSLQLEMERSLVAQECLLQEKAAIEQESSELHDFLQHEKAAMCEALKDLENDYHTCKQQLASRDEEVKVLRDECRHLVRLNEQRRQENRMLQTKYVALESKSKELVAQQNSSVSGASGALSGLHTRLDSLVEQLVSSYNISDRDLEDVGFQSDIQTSYGSCGGDGDAMHECEGSAMRPTLNGLDASASGPGHQHLHHQLPQSSDGSLSPQRNQSFIAAVISAIRHATTPAGKRLLARNSKRASGVRCASAASNNNNNHTELPSNGDDSDSTEMLDSETEPCLMMDNVLEDVTMPDSHSHNMVSSCTGMISQIEIPSELVNVNTGDESLHNLSQAIANCQQMELHVSAMHVQKAPVLPPKGQHLQERSASEDVSCHDSVAEIPSLMEYCSSAQTVVDQVIEVDSLVTKLLKVLRLIQMDNDNCIQQLIVDKNKLQQNKEDMLEKLKDLEDVNIKLQDELMDATQELMLKNNDLSNSKAEIQRHRNEIDRLTEDVCNLSTLCSSYRKLSPTTEFPPMQLLSPDSSGVASTGVSVGADNDDVVGILNLLKMWHAVGHLADRRICSFLSSILPEQQPLAEVAARVSTTERERVYANQLENILTVLGHCEQLEQTYPALQQLRQDLQVVKVNANWVHMLDESADCGCNSGGGSDSADTADENANAASNGACRAMEAN